MTCAEPGNTILSNTIEKELMNSINRDVATRRQKALNELYMGNPPTLSKSRSESRIPKPPPTPSWLFKGNNYHGIGRAAERMIMEAANKTPSVTASKANTCSEANTSRPATNLSVGSSVASEKRPPPPGFGGGTMTEWVGEQKKLPGGRNWLDR
eukprot:TRINITY_DN114821_c0_g1_i1.p1 TRINITY_DN114821_c0_g1~~TRINITY_DN114821_c0_g1_i1.p1  ORF type:complete len:154 (+),score=20.50 TRINITY_DN114821_c0_g1_i1:79-540(+)